MADPAAALMDAVHANDTTLVAALLDRHPELKRRLDTPLPGNWFGAPPLIRAVEHGNRDLIEILLRAGADINASSDWWAGSFGVLDTVKPDLVPFLLERGALMDAHAAARLGRQDDLETFVAATPDIVHSRGGGGQTPLHFTSTVAIARLLLDHGDRHRRPRRGSRVHTGPVDARRPARGGAPSRRQGLPDGYPDGRRAR